jgi:hypothetical protein
MEEEEEENDPRLWEDDTFLHGEKVANTKITPAAAKKRKTLPPTSRSTATTTIDLAADQTTISEIESFLDNPMSRNRVKREREVTCRACAHGYFSKRKDSKLVKDMARLIRIHAYSISLDTLLEAIHEAGEEDRQATIAEGEEDPGEWTHEEIQYHLFNCMKDPGLFCLKQIIDLTAQLESLNKHLWKKNEDGTREPDKNVFLLMFQTQKQIKEFLTLTPEKTISFNPKLNVQHHSKKTTTT